MRLTSREILIPSFIALLVSTAATQQLPQTTKERIEGNASVKTEELTGTVLQADDGTLVVRMAGGGIREFNPPESRRFMIDGKELTVNDLKPGTKLKATVTTTTTPVTERTTTIGTGKVWFVQGNTVILTLPNNENRMYKVQESYRFNVNGHPATVHDLRKGMTVSAEKIVEEPRTEIASNTTVTGSAPPAPKPVAAEAPSRVAETPAPPPQRPEAAPAPAPAPAPTPAPRVAEAAPAPARLPKTASLLPLAGLLGFVCTGASLGLRARRRIFGSRA